MPKIRLDLLMVERGLVESRSLAQRLVMAGEVRVNGEIELKPSTNVPPDASLAIDKGASFVSRGGEKLQAALEAFPISIKEQVCADVGASTGGFTDCLLQHGALRVYAIDVGKGILHWKLRQDPRVVVMESLNARHLQQLPEPITLATVDASFISLKILLPVIRGWFSGQPGRLEPGFLQPGFLQPGAASLVALIKPQFEAGRRDVARGQGVVRDPQIHRRVLLEVLGYAGQTGYRIQGLIRSPILGPKGNVEFLAWLGLPAAEATPTTNVALEDLVAPLFTNT
jgi:23S rRNA (cytidine1920-2'-O)/16S rRNA (cytidine1409-2'-O)-methyltransferase